MSSANGLPRITWAPPMDGRGEAAREDATQHPPVRLLRVLRSLSRRSRILISLWAVGPMLQPQSNEAAYLSDARSCRRIQELSCRPAGQQHQYRCSGRRSAHPLQ